VLLHELGHLLGRDHADAADEVMAEALPGGVRHVPTAESATLFDDVFANDLRLLLG
jgi:hypothetical protein